MATKFETLDASGETIEIAAGVPFQTFWVLEDGETTAFTVSHPWNALDVYGPDDLARFTITATTIPDPPVPAPMIISRMQAQLELHAVPSPTNAGKTLLDDVNAALAASSDGSLLIYWNTASDFHRDHPKILAMATAFGWSSDYVDSLFQAASLLS